MTTVTLTPATAAMMLTHSPAHTWRHIPENPRGREWRPWHSERVAAAAHCMHTQPVRMPQLFSVAPGRTTLSHTLGGQLVLSDEQHSHAEAAARAIQESGGKASQLLAPDAAKAPEYWSEYSAELRPGVFYQCAAHTYHAASRLLVMHHPVAMATIDQCAKALTNRLWAATAVLTIAAMEVERPAEDSPLHLAFVLQETRPPYDCIALTITDEWLELAEQQATDILDLAEECLANDHWPLSESIATIEPPAWAFKMRKPE